MKKPLLLLGILLMVSFWLAGSARAITAQTSPIVRENLKQGTSAWRLTRPASSREIEGYASLTSVNRGGQISLFVNTAEPTYTIEVYRMGWYGGAGGRLMLGPISRTGRQQMIPNPNQTTGMVECSWTDPYVLTVPTDPNDPTVWASGYYLAKLTAATSGAQAYIMFVVRDDARTSHFLMQSSVTTFQAYNNWAGKSLYDFQSPTGRASKVSFNRPYGPFNNYVAGLGAGQFLNDGEGAPPAGWEYNMVRFLEREGEDVTYCTNIDTHQTPNLLLSHDMFLIVGHDEYWSRQMRENLIAARDQGVSIGVFSANTLYWQVRLEPSGAGAANRTLVCYKGSPDGTVSTGTRDPYYLDTDPANDRDITVRWRDSLPSSTRVALPEEAVLGCQYVWGADSVNADLVVTNASHWVFQGTGLVNGSVIPGVVGYEVDSMQGSSPPGTIQLAHSPIPIPAGQFADMTIYTAPSGATVFNTGSIQWSWGLDDYNVGDWRTSRLSAAAQQMTRNVLHIGSGVPTASPGGRYRGAPGAPIQFSSAGSSDPDGSTLTCEWDFGDGTTSVGPAPTHVYAIAGRYTVILTVTDNEGESSSKATAADVGMPLSLWDDDTQPMRVGFTDLSPVELGVRFRSETNGYIAGVRFHKDSANGGGLAHTGSLWTNTGTLLATGTFTNETAYGWQELRFAPPVPVTAGTTYVASYYTPKGGYSYNNGYFAGAGYDNPPLHALQDGIDGLNGCYNLGGPGFPASSYQSTHYWVDVLFVFQLDTTAPAVSAVSPAGGATGVDVGTSLSARFSEAMNPATINTSTFELRNPAGALITAAVAYDAITGVATLQPSSPLAGLTTYTAKVKGGSTDPRAKDLSGNALPADVTWTFTTQDLVRTIWSASVVPVTKASSDNRATEVGVKFKSDVAGYIKGIRFYKGTGNTGTHSGSLWSLSGTRLRQATFANETATGWQEVRFSSPVAITAGTVYVASYFAPVGRYAADDRYFTNAGVDNPPLHALKNSNSSNNGVYRLTSSSAFPNKGKNATNFWVDVVFSTSP